MRRLLLALLLSFATSEAVSQRAPSIVQLAGGRQIFVTGLRTWTVAMIQDSLAKYSPGDSLQSHACAAVLRYKLHFADAAAMTLSMEPTMPNQVFVDVREPQDSARVRYRVLPMDTAAPRQEWRAATSVLATSPGAFRAAVAAHVGSFKLRPSDTAATRLVAFFGEKRAAADRRLALRALAESPNYLDRSVAAVILTNFPDRKDTWQALLDGMRESDGQVKGSSLEAFKYVAAKSSLKPDWSALAPGVHAMLDGTSLFMLDGLIGVLTDRAEIGPKLAKAFLAGGGEMLVNYTESPQPFRSSPARKLLVKLRGADLGNDANAWRAWIDGLK
jgi:hypothetical protein